MKSSIKLILGILAVLALAFIAWRLIRLISLFLGYGSAQSEPDPMFEVITPAPTRPEELDIETTQAPHLTLDDYIPEFDTPVDKTADQLIEEAKARTGQ